MNDPLNVQPPDGGYVSPEKRAEVAQKKTLLEKRKTFGSARMSEDEAKKREETVRLNREALLQLVAEKDLWIRREDFDAWRPTARVAGEITGVKTGLTIIATDGNVAYFEDENDFAVFFGHIQMFTGEVRTLYAMPKEGVIKEGKDKPKKEKRHVRDAMDLLKQLQQASAASTKGTICP